MDAKNDETPTAPTDEVSESNTNDKVIDMRTNVAKKSEGFTIFKFGKSEIRVIDKNGEPWFVAKDVCDALQLTNSRKALTSLDEDEKDSVTLSYGNKGNPNHAVVSESGMYTLVLRCRDAVNQGSVPHAFRKWVTADVLPALRKHGVYEKPTAKKKCLPGKITADQQEAIKQLVLTRGKSVPKEKQAKATITLWSALKSHFGCTYKEIDGEDFVEALSLVSRIALDGEYIAKGEPEPKREEVAPRRAPPFRFIVNMVVEDVVTGQKETLKGGANSATEIVSGTAKKFGIHIFDMMPVPLTAFC